MRQEQSQTVSQNQQRGETDEEATTGKSVRPSLIEVCGQGRALCPINYWFSKEDDEKSETKITSVNPTWEMK